MRSIQSSQLCSNLELQAEAYRENRDQRKCSRACHFEASAECDWIQLYIPNEHAQGEYLHLKNNVKFTEERSKMSLRSTFGSSWGSGQIARWLKWARLESRRSSVWSLLLSKLVGTTTINRVDFLKKFLQSFFYNVFYDYEALVLRVFLFLSLSNRKNTKEITKRKN